MIDIALVVDHKWRDLPGMVLLSDILKKKYGFSVKLIPYNLWEKTLIFDKPKILCVSILYGKRGLKIIETCKQTGAKIAILMTEGRPNTIDSLKYSTGPESNSKYADLWICWSETVRNYMLEEKVLPQEKLPVLGCNRFDIYFGSYKKLIQNKKDFLIKYGLNPDMPVISWATNFTHAKFFKNNTKFMLNDWKDLGLTKYKSYSDPLGVAKDDYFCRIESSKIIKEYLKKHKNLQLMIKPHPAEDHSFYIDFANECNKELGGKRVAFIGFEYIWDVLNATDVHIHRLCTTGIEAWFLDKPSIELHIKDYLPWSLSLDGSASDGAKGNDMALNEKQFFEITDFYLNGGKPASDKMIYRKKYIKKWLYKVDGFRSESYAEAISQLFEKEEIKIKNPHIKGNADLYLKGLINTVLGPSPKQALKIWKKDKIDDIGHVDKIIMKKDILLWEKKIDNLRRDL
ncbi:MAG: hypothetical protein GX447_06175 [Elusimicrobia bacterium]|nr:hypothetical protein [Elusimicrobiota bacterium]